MNVNYRARFRGPKGALNPLGAKTKAETTVEVYQHRPGEWYAREVDTPEQRKFERLGRGPGRMVDAITSKAEVESNFEERLTEWEMYDRQGRKLEQGDVNFKSDGTVERKPPTHIGRGATESKKTSRAACGKTVPNGQIIKTTRPTCDQCRIIYDKEHKAQ